MELKDYIKILAGKIWIIILFAVIVGALSFYFVNKKPTTYSGFRSISITREEKADASYYQYDGYYSLNSAVIQAKGLSSWLGSPSAIIEMYKLAGQTAPSVDDKTAKDFATIKNDLNSPVVTISMEDTDRNILLEKLSSIDSLVNDYFKDSNQKSEYIIKISDSSVVENTENSTISIIAGFISGLIIGIVFAFAVEYFKNDK
ncbi:MAG: hypothetical protein WCW17_02140 [Patescibacteria group bacterium]|jgi:capsular polysaccharide biosynthesis protein